MWPISPQTLLITGQNISASKHTICMSEKRDFLFFFSLLIIILILLYLLNIEQRWQSVKSERRTMKTKQGRESTRTFQNISLHRALVPSRTIYVGKNSSISNSVFHRAAVILRTLMNTAMNVRVPQNAGKFFISFSLLKEFFCFPEPKDIKLFSFRPLDRNTLHPWRFRFACCP